MDLSWLTLAMNAISAVVGQWVVADDEQKAAIAARALQACSDMLTDRAEAKTDHDALTAQTLAAIEAALAAKPV